MKHLHTFDEINWDGVELVEIKYRQVNERLLYSLDARIRSIIEKMMSYPVNYNYDRCLLDVKVRNLKKDQYSCALPQFHYDWVRTYDELPTQHETHFIYTNIDGTEFKDGKCLDNSIYTYGRELHRGVLMKEDITRILIRLSYVNNKRTNKK